MLRGSWRIVSERGNARGRFDNGVVGDLTPLVGHFAPRRSRYSTVAGTTRKTATASSSSLGARGLRQIAHNASIPGASRRSFSYLLTIFWFSFHVNSAFYPIIKQLEWAAGIVRTDTGPRKLDKLEAVLKNSAEDETEAARHRRSVVSMPFGERYPRRCISPGSPKKLNGLWRYWREQLVVLSRRDAVLVLFEDALVPTQRPLPINRWDYSQGGGPAGNDHCDLSACSSPTPWLDLGHTTMLKLNHLRPKPGG